MKRSIFLKLMTLLWLIVVGGANISANAAEITLDFSKDGGLLGDLSNKSNNPSTGNFEIGGYSVGLINCSQQSNKTLVIAGNGETGSISFTFSKAIASVKFISTEVSSGTTMTVTLDEKTLQNTPTPTTGENTVDLTGNETKGKKCTFSFTKKTKLTSVTFVIDESSTEPDDTPTEWVKLLKYNDDSEVTDRASLPAGQVLKLESLVEGFVPNSTIDNDYVVTYSLDGAPTFNGKTGGDANKYWKDGKEDTKKGNGYIYRRGIALEGEVGKEVTLNINIFKVTYNTDGSYQSAKLVTTDEITKTYKFTLTDGNRPTANDFKFSPATSSSHTGSNTTYDKSHYILDLTESCTATGKNGNTIIAKYSTDNTYDIQQILNAANVSLDNTTTGVFSTKENLRKTSAVQITPDGLISSEVARAFYWYIPARQAITLEAVPSYSGLSVTGQDKEETVTLTAYYMKDGKKTYVNLQTLAPITIKSNDNDIATTDGNLTYATDYLSATFTIKAVDNGTTHINVTSPKTSYVNDKGEAESPSGYYAAATDVTVKVVDGTTMAPPTINPETSDYHISFKSSVQADANYSASYYVEKSTSTADTQTTLTFEEMKKKGKFIEKGQKIETDIEAGDGNVYTVYAVSYDEPTQTLGTRVVKSTYTYVKIENPVLTPGIEGNDNYYSFDDDQLTIVASVATADAQVYYTINSADANVTKDNGILYDGQKKITITQSSRIKAVAYKDGIYSDVVIYRYNMQKTDLDAPKFFIGNSKDPFTTRNNIGNEKIRIQATYTDKDGNTQNVVDENGKVKDGFTIYYTTDGQMPSDQSETYKEPFTVSGTVKVIYAYVKAKDGSISDRSSLTLTNDNLHVWETTEDNCPGGVLSNTHQELKSTDESTTWVKAEFGGFASETDKRDNKQQWDHYTSKEASCGTNIDGVGFYSIAPNIDAKDEMGVLYNHSKANTEADGYQTHKSTFGLPAMGAYTKFEPQMDGTLTIYCFQEGALYYRDAIGTKECFNSRFLRKRPVYFIDEAGVAIAPEEVVASGTLSSKWKDVEKDNFAENGETQNGIKQTLFSKKQTENIYNMFNKVITEKGATSETSLSKLIVYLNDGSDDNHKAVAGYGLPNNKDDKGEDKADNVVKAKTGVCIPSASYMKYTFKVKGGKTYFFFGWMTKVGIRGFGFEPDAAQNYSGDLEINTGKTETDGKNDIKAGKYAKVTLKRTFAANRWTTLVLPFSVSASKVQEVFGTDEAKAQILHYRTVHGGTMYFFKHYHQMIVAGTPVLIKPTKEVKNPEFTNVNVESTSVTDIPCNDYGYKGEDGSEASTYMMKGSYNYQSMPKGSYYLSKNDGTVKHLTKVAPIGATYAYMTGANETLTTAAKTAYNNLMPTSLDDETTGIDFINADDNIQGTSIENGYIYNVNGQLVGKNIDDINKLSKGIYIVNGKKMIIQ